MRRLNADPDFAKAHSERAAERMRRLHADPDFAKANSERSGERMRRLHADPDFAKANSERMRRQHAEGVVRTCRACGVDALHGLTARVCDSCTLERESLAVTMRGRGATYAEIGACFGLTGAWAHGVVAELAPHLLGSVRRLRDA